MSSNKLKLLTVLVIDSQEIFQQQSLSYYYHMNKSFVSFAIKACISRKKLVLIKDIWQESHLH